MKKMIAIALVATGLTACNSYSPGDRALAGGVIGAGTGAVIGGLATGRPGGAVAGAVIGGAGGAILGAATTPQRGYYRGGRCRGIDEYGNRVVYAC